MQTMIYRMAKEQGPIAQHYSIGDYIQCPMINHNGK